MTDILIQVTHTRAAVNCGDHAQDITRALHVTENTTIGDLVRATLANFPDEDYLTIRAAKIEGEGNE